MPAGRCAQYESVQSYAEEEAGHQTASCGVYGGEPSVGRCQDRGASLRLTRIVCLGKMITAQGPIGACCESRLAVGRAWVILAAPLVNAFESVAKEEMIEASK